MWECSYSREPVDFRLLWIRFVRKIWIVLVATIAGAILFTGIHVGVRLLEKGGRVYRVTDVLDIAYVGDTYEYEVNYFFFNYLTWNEVSDYDSVVDSVYESMEGALTKEQIKAYTEATLVADVHHLHLYTDTNDKALSLKLSNAFRKAMIQFINDYDRMESVSILNTGDISDITKLRVPLAVATGAVIGFFVSVIWILIAEITDSSIWIPATLEKRYHVPTLTANSMEEFQVNCERTLNGLHNISVVAVDENSTPAEGCFGDRQITVFSKILSDNAELEAVKNSDACVVSVAAGGHNGCKVERTLEQLGRSGVKVTATMLVKEDAKLIKRYYR